MEFHEKLQELRKQKGLTQEEVAERLYVSRTAVSKWESGRGYPSIDSMKAIAAFFSVTLDDLLSPAEALTVADGDKKRTEKHFVDLVFGLLDVASSLLLFLPLFAERASEAAEAVSLLALCGGGVALCAAYVTFVAVLTIFGILTLALQGCEWEIWLKTKSEISLLLGGGVLLLFIAGLHPYAAVYAFVLLSVKALMLIKRP